MLRARSHLLLALVVTMIAASGLFAAAPQQLPLAAPIAELLAPQVAQANISSTGGNFDSDVPCLESPDQFATSCYANTLVYDTSSSGTQLRPVPLTDTALVRFNTTGKTPLAQLAQLGSVYGMAYDDGTASGGRRLLLGAYTRRLTGFGPGGPGAIYAYNLTTGAVSLFTTVAGTVNHHSTSGDGLDQQVAPWVGASSLGDLEIGPTGTTLYVMNMETRQINRYSLASGSAYAPISINFAAISSDPATQANLRPMGLEFQPLVNGVSNNLLYVGIVDSGERSSLVVPTAYVIAINVLTGVQTTVLTQPLDAAAIAPRFNDSVNPMVAWRPWRSMGRTVVYPMPLVSDIQFSRDGETMLVGLRDRNGDAYINPGESTPDSENWWRVQEQGDVLVYDTVNGAWQLQTRGGITTPSDFFRDNIIGSSAAPHSENLMGAMALAFTGAGSAMTEQIVATAITPLVGGTSGANWYNLNPSAYERQAAVELIPQGDMWKSATLGDLENLCTSAFIGDRIWSDANGNGVQDTGEPGIGGIVVRLLDANNSVVGSVTTNSSGVYQFAVKPNVAYALDLATSNFSAGGPLFQKFLSPQNRGGSDTADSDADQISRRIDVAGQGRDAYNMSFDFGLVSDPLLANGQIGDAVWNDLNSNGVQDSGEPGVTGVTVRLIDAATNTVAATQTTSSGTYLFQRIIPGTYLVEFVPPNGINASPRDTGGDDARDSDANAASSWRTQAVTVIADTANYTLDLGLIMGANVRVVKTGPASAPVGTRASYTLTYINDGPAQADNVVVRDTWTPGLNYVSANPAPSSLAGSTLAWNIGTMTPGAQGTITVVFDVDANAPASATNQAQITTTTTNNPPGDDRSTASTQFPRPNVWVQKAGPATVTVGNQLSYTLTYGNNGGANAGSVGVVDTLPGGLSFVSANPAASSASGQNITWDLGALTSGQQGSITVVAQSNVAAANGTVVVNTAQISTPTLGDAPGDNTASASTTLQRADVRVTKSSPTSFPVVTGQQVTYYLDYANAGPATAAGVSLTDSVPAQIINVSWSCTSGCSTSGTGNTINIDLGTLSAGTTGRIRVIGNAQTGTNREDFTNTAIIATTIPEVDTANNQSSVPGAVWTSDLQIIKLAQAQVVAGDTLTATLSYRNNGPAAEPYVGIMDMLPMGFTFVSSDPAPSKVNGGALEWLVGPLADGQSGQINLVLRSDTRMTNDITILNQAAIFSPTATDRDTTNNRGSALTVVIARSDLSVVKAAPARVSAGDMVQYTLSYRNNGASTAGNVILTDKFPVELDYLSAVPPPTITNTSQLLWRLNDLLPNQSGIITVQMRSRASQTVPTLAVTNTIQITSSTVDPVLDNNISTVTTDIETADVSVIKRSPGYIVAGLPFTVTLDYANVGPATAQNVTLRDLLPTGLRVVSSTPPPIGSGLRWNLGDLPGGASGSISVVLQAPTTAISGTTYTNVAVIDTPTSIDRNLENDTSSTLSVVRPNADLSIIKSGPTVPVVSGGEVVYTLNYRNQGPSQAKNVLITDRLPAGFTFGSAVPPPTTNVNNTLAWNVGTLDSAAEGTITVTGSLTGDGTTTTRTNLATITSPITPDPAPENNASAVDTTVLKSDLRVSKTDNTSEVEPGDTLTYMITVENVGMTAATGVLLRETPPAGATVPPGQWAAQNDGTYTLEIGTLAPGASMTVEFPMTLPNPLSAGAPTIQNLVVVSDDGSKGNDPTPDDNSSVDTDQTTTGRIGDTVWYDKNGDAQQDAGEVGLGGITLQLIDPATNRAIASTVSDQQGNYLFNGLRPGTYQVTLVVETTQIGNLRGYRYTTGAVASGTITRDAPEDRTLDIGLNNPGSTDVVLAYGRAERGTDGAATIRWRTLDETNTLRFHVMRSMTDVQHAVEVGMLQSKGSAGGTYAVSDTAAPSQARYWLVEVERGGKTTTYGPLQQQEPTAVQDVGDVIVDTTSRSSAKLFLPLIGR